MSTLGKRDIVNVKYIIVGDSTAGKSCLLMQFTDKRFQNTDAVTIGVEFGSRTIEVGDQHAKVQAWDTAGQEKFRSITRSFFRNTACAIVVYDITNRQSFNSVAGWLDECREHANNPNLVIALVGNKVDLESRRIVTPTEGSQLASKHGAFFFETSAKTGVNVESAFIEPASHIVRLLNEGSITLGGLFDQRKACGITIEKAPSFEGSALGAARQKHMCC